MYRLVFSNRGKGRKMLAAMPGEGKSGKTTMADKLVEMAKGLETCLREAACAHTADGEYERAQSFLAVAKEAASLTGRLESLRAASTTTTNTEDLDGSADPRRARFQFTDSRLILVGRSRHDHTKEYRHEVPLQAVVTILSHVRELAANGQRFAHAQLMERYGRTKPEYHVRTVMRLLRHMALVEKHGRGSYRVKNQALDDLSTDALRRQLG